MPLCSSTCTTLKDPEQRWLSSQGLLSAGSRFIFVKCDEPGWDIYLPASWTALVTSGALRLGPMGRWSKEAAEQTSTDVWNGCKLERLTKVTGSTLTFTTNFIPCDQISHYAWLRDLTANFKSYRVIPVTCPAADSGEEKFYVSDPYFEAALTAGFVSPTISVGDSPGFEFSLSTVPDELFSDNPTEPVSVTFSVFIPGSLPMGAVTLPGVAAALEAADV